MRSMTGFGRGTAGEADHVILVTAQSWNHRHLDLQIRLPNELRALEGEIRSEVQKAVARGRCEIQVKRNGQEEREASLSLDGSALEAFLIEVEPWVAKGRISPQLTVGDLCRSPFAVRREAGDDLTEAEIAALRQAVTHALAELVAEREREGAATGRVLAELVADLGRLVVDLQERRSTWIAGIEERVRERLAEILPGGISEVPPERLAQEVVLLADRSDVAEELDRLQSHLAAFVEICDGPGPHGRRLEFWSQEILRELNTVGSKARDAATTARVVEAKVINERIREQVQNVE